MGILLKKKPAVQPIATEPPPPAKKVLKFGGAKNAVLSEISNAMQEQFNTMAAIPGAVVVQDSVYVPDSAVGMTERQKNALMDVGLLPAEPSKVKIKKKQAFGSYSPGDKVVITNELYSWVDYWRPGDTATVIRFIPPVLEARADGNKYAVVEVKLDLVRDKQRPTCFLHGWEVAPYVSAVA